MAVNHFRDYESRWDQTAFEAMRATWSPERIAEDEKILQNFFALAADVPLLAEALEWGKAHGVKMFVDRSTDRIGGYYTRGTGVLGIRAKNDPRNMINAIVHEMRHAWQDYHGLLVKRTPDFTEYQIEDSLTEADACAFGYRAAEQYRLAKFRQQHKRIPDDLKKFLKTDEETDLARRFHGWFSHDGYLTRYGSANTELYAHYYQLLPMDKVQPAKDALPTQYEFRGGCDALGERVNINNVQDVLRLGAHFNGAKNYLVALQRDVLPKKILNPSLANTFWGAANDEQRKLTAAIRKAYMKEKLSPENRKKNRENWHPWP